MEQINYENLIPQKPLSDVVAFAHQNGKLADPYLIYRDCAGNVRVVCSECGHTFLAPKVPAGDCRNVFSSAAFGWQNERTGEPVISGGKTLCPFCGKEAKTVHVGNMHMYSGEIVDDDWVTELSRLPVEGRKDRLVVTDWCIRRCINKKGSTRYEIWPYSAWVVEETKITRLMGYLENIGGRVHLFGSWKQRKTFVNVYGKAKLITPWDKALLEGTTAENSKLDLYQDENHGRYLVAYLALWRRRPAVENLMVQGCGDLVRTWIRKETESYYYRGGIPKLDEVNWKEKRPAQMLGLNKEEFRQMRQGHWSADDLEKYRMIRDSGLPVRLPRDMQLLSRTSCYDCNRILQEAPKADFWRTVRYLAKQEETWSTLLDYRHMAREAGRDMEDNLVQWPRRLTEAHDRYVEERNARWARKEAAERAKEAAEREALFRKRTAELEWLAFEAGGMLIRPCVDENELKREGKALHHCVGNYAKNHAEGKTAILFIRRMEEPDKPFFTLEFDEKAMKVRQNRGLRNCARTPEVTVFEQAWLDYVRNVKAKERSMIA